MFGNILSALDLSTTLTFFVVLLISYVIWDSFHCKRVNIPGPLPWPVLGNMPTLIGSTNASKTFMKLQKKYGDLVFIRLGSLPIVLVFGYKKVREILVDNADKTKFRPRQLYIAKKLFPNEAGVVFSNGQEWSDIRKFSLVALKDFGVGKKSIEERIHEEVQYISDLFTKQKNRPIDISKVFSKATSNIISNIIFGSRFEYDDPVYNELLENVSFIVKNAAAFRPENVFPILDKINPASKVHQIMQKRQAIESYVQKRIDEQRNSFDPNNIRNLLDLYIEQETNTESKISEKSLFLTITDLYTAGTDTTSISLRWCMLYMIKYPDVQKRCRDEIVEVVGDRLTVAKDKDKIPYVMATLHELQRIATIAPLSVPHTAIEDIHIDGMTIPKNTTILCNLMSVHHDPEMWEDPEVFRPERFLTKDGQFERKDAYSPFSMGPRTCLGKQLAETELILFFTSLLQRFNLTKADKDDVLITSGLHTGVVETPQPFKMCFIPRC